MSQVLYTKEIADHIRDLIWDNLQGSLSLVVSQVGDVSFYSAEEEFTNIIPGCFVKPNGNASIAMRTMKFHYDIVYPFRIVYVKKFTQASDVVKDKMDDINSIAELFFDNTRLSSLSMANSQVIRSHPVGVQYDPPEEGFLSLLNSQLVAGAVNIEVRTTNSSP